MCVTVFFSFFFFKQKTAYEMRISDWSSDVCSSDLIAKPVGWPDGTVPAAAEGLAVGRFADGLDHPRVLYTLPNGDVLAALAREPRKEVKGFMGRSDEHTSDLQSLMRISYAVFCLIQEIYPHTAA